ncbi:unnamed protein product [Brassica oleracea]|uniref:(rape) hypothetical protein n=1 Tax=Brassica napus TaxID=3708 RepID=A0A816JV38_BRANA|nr:unnamed protein product [Brassica napus]
MASSSHNTFEGSFDDTFDQYFGLPDGGSDFGSGSVSIPVQSPVVAADQTHPNSSLYVGDDLDPSREWPKHNSAVQAVEKMNGNSLGDDVLFVGRAQKKSEREQELRRKFEQERMNRFEKSQRENLSLKNLDDSVDDEKLKEMFSEFGNVTSSKVIAKK